MQEVKYYVNLTLFLNEGALFIIFPGGLPF